MMGEVLFGRAADRTRHTVDRLLTIQNVAASPDRKSAESMGERQQKITFAEMRSSGVRGLLIYCADYKCSHYIAISGDRWPDDVRLSDLEPKFTCSACGKRGTDIRPDFHWDKPVALSRGY
jgi:hypothetical protein